MKVEKVYDLNIEHPVPDWLKNHPHMHYKSLAEYKGRSNVIYAARQFFTDDENSLNVNGSALFKFHEDLILTKKGQANRTRWELPHFFHPETGVQVSYNPSARWEKAGEKAELRSASRGQEFVVMSDPVGRINRWCVDIVKGYDAFE